jgi:hypothetical protein
LRGETKKQNDVLRKLEFKLKKIQEQSKQENHLSDRLNQKAKLGEFGANAESL